MSCASLTWVCWPAVGAKHAWPAHHHLAAQGVHDHGTQLLGAGHGGLQQAMVVMKQQPQWVREGGSQHGAPGVFWGVCVLWHQHPMQ